MVKVLDHVICTVLHYNYEMSNRKVINQNVQSHDLSFQVMTIYGIMFVICCFVHLKKISQAIIQADLLVLHALGLTSHVLDGQTN